MFSVTKIKGIILTQALLSTCLGAGALAATTTPAKLPEPAKVAAVAQKQPDEPAKTPLAPQKTPAHVENTKPSNDAAAEQTCSKLFQKFTLPLQDLWKRRGPDLRPENTDGYALIEEITSEQCKDAETRKAPIELLARILNSHSGKIGVILPITGNTYSKHMIAAFEAYVRSSNLDPKKILVVIDSQSKDERVYQALASLIFEHKVTAIVGGTEASEATILRAWAAKVMVPTFLMSEPPATAPIPLVYYAHPTEKSLAKAAADANVRFGHKRVSILSPSDQHSDQFIVAFEEAAKINGITITDKVPYDSRRFDSMESAARKIFHLDASERRDELKKLYESAKKQAAKSGERFNPKMVALQPDIQQDAVLIPDNFKMVRHFAKIFGYLGVRRMPLFGHYEWRSQGLISPWDSFMNGSYFVDFQGAYTSLPDPIKISTPDSPYLAAADKIEQADFSLIAWRAIEWPLKLSQKKSDMRRKMDKLIPKKPENRTDVSFDANNTINWAPSVFTVTGNGSNTGHINLLGQ